MEYMNRNGLLVPRHLVQWKDRGRFGGTFLGKIIKGGDLDLFGNYVGGGEVVDEFEWDNLIVNQGLDHILGVEFTAVSQVTTWYMSVFSNNYTPVSSDTAATFPGNAGESSAYTATTRPAFVPVEASQNVNNSASPASFTANATVTWYGGFLVSSSTKGGTGGVLFAAAQFSTPKSMGNTDVFLMTYSFNGSSV